MELNRRKWLAGFSAAAATAGLAGQCQARSNSSSFPASTIGSGRRLDPAWEQCIRSGLDYLARTQSTSGQWSSTAYPVAISALAGLAMICSGSTTTQGPYSKHISRCTDFLLSKCRDNGLIGDPNTDNRYTYGHGFSMLLLSQVLGEEGFEDRRQELIEKLKMAVQFCAFAQTDAGGWGYVSAKDGANYDEGSTTITQVQGLRGCRNAGIPVSVEIIERAKKYIYNCMNPDGGISYSSKQMGTSRPAITAAALAALYNAGDYSGEHVPKMMKSARDSLHDLQNDQGAAFGHWHYTYLYYSQVVYRQGDEEWLPFRDRLYRRIVSEQKSDGHWDGQISPVYITACSLIIMQLDYGLLPIYQR